MGTSSFTWRFPENTPGWATVLDTPRANNIIMPDDGEDRMPLLIAFIPGDWPEMTPLTSYFLRPHHKQPRQNQNALKQ
jgi:hypothetical protein